MKNYRIRKHISSIELMHKEIRYGIEMERAYGLSNAHVPVCIEATAVMIKIGFMSLICKVLGHKMIDHSCGGPDTGCVSVECTRCGFSSHTTLY